ncbi:MAG: type II CRISPR-associated endonuclease Cas1 [Sphingobacteriia bacterium]|nr:type II CRISPR-associated endonuclease Cas1 [Sphingobacteriia bacterium]
MIKRTLYFGNGCYLHKKNDQLVIEPDDKSIEQRNIPIEDIGIVVLDHYQVKITNALLQALTENNTAVIICDQKHLPASLLLPFSSHHAFTEKLYHQLESSLPLRKNLWQQTISAKIKNQAAVLGWSGIANQNMLLWAKQVRSGDPDNFEARAAAYYWENFVAGFRRNRFGEPPNNLLNYGYAILRAVVARALVSSGMLPAVGIHHRNKYNPFCLADDVMEPFRPYVDKLVLNISEQEDNTDELNPSIKARLLAVPVIDIKIDGEKSPLMVGIQRTTASLMKCFEGKTKKLLYPIM